MAYFISGSGLSLAHSRLKTRMQNLIDRNAETDQTLAAAESFRNGKFAFGAYQLDGKLLSPDMNCATFGVPSSGPFTVC